MRWTFPFPSSTEKWTTGRMASSSLRSDPFAGRCVFARRVTAMLDHWMVSSQPFWLWGCDAWSSGGSSSGSRWCCMAHLCRWFSKILSTGPISQSSNLYSCGNVHSSKAICVWGEQVEVVSQTTEMDEFTLRGWWHGEMLKCCTCFFASWNVWVLIGKMQCNTFHSIKHQTLPDMTLATFDSLPLRCKVRDDYFLNRCCQELCQTLQLSQDSWESQAIFPILVAHPNLARSWDSLDS